MKSSARVVVIGGGVVGASVLYHLTKAGWTDVVLVERKQLTAGSTWHAAGGMHTLNGDPNVARLQQYTVNLYKEIEKESGQNCGIHLPGGLMLADTPERLDFLRMAQARGRYLGMHMEMLSMKEAKALNPLLEEKYFVGALYDEDEGSVDPYGVTHAYAICAKNRGAEVYTDTWVTGLNHRPDGTWDVITDKDHTIHAEHVVNAGGLWAREVGRMCGLELPVLAMEHHYLMTEPMDEVIEYNKTMGRELPHIIDFAGEIYARQEGQSILLGTYEQENRPWAAKETPWDFVFQLLPHDLERIAPELERGFAHFPAVGRAGIKKFVNGPFTFSPDGNPLVGPIRGMRGMWSACGVMAGLSQGGGVGLSLANWMVNGDPGADIWGMDVARYGDYATLAYTHAKVRENYSRRFRITFPNEELAAARPLLTTPIYDRLLEHNAVMGVGFGLEHPLWFQDKGKEPVEEVTFYRSSAFKNVGEESRAVRERVGFSEASNFAKYKVSGPGSAAWLQGLQGRIEGEFSVSRIGEEEFFLFGSQAAEVHHPRWFLSHLPEGSPIRFETLALSMVGLTVAGPRSRDVLQKLTDTSLATKDFPFMSFRRVNIGMAPVWLSRMTYTGDLGYEIWIAPEYQRYLFDLIWDAGKEFDMRMFGFRALITMRLEKNFGTWYREFRPIYTPLESGMERAMKFDHEFIGRAAVEAEMKTGPARKLVMFKVDVDETRPADVLGDEPVFHNGEVVGWITSGGYAHYSGVSLALGYIPAALAVEGTTGFEIEIIGNMRPAHLQLEPVLDPSGSRMRA
ncbi:FAD-dependent oxidoreductase [bacterium]|nr:FAD-dependent oxidoreductase [bacterium]